MTGVQTCALPIFSVDRRGLRGIASFTKGWLLPNSRDVRLLRGLRDLGIHQLAQTSGCSRGSVPGSGGAQCWSYGRPSVGNSLLRVLNLDTLGTPFNLKYGGEDSRGFMVRN